MKLATNKALYLLSGLVLLMLLILPIRHFILNVDATGETYQIHILEVTDSGSSDLASLKSGMSDVTVDTMSMKRFVALRDDLDGKYDAIFIGKGVYSISGVQGKIHNTTNVMNDITSLKAKEITDTFINKGLYVIFNKQPFDNQTTSQRGILYNTFNPYRTATPKPNVIFVNDSELKTMINSLKAGTSPLNSGLKQRPRLLITNKSSIIDYSVNQNNIYKPGDELNFKFNVSNVTNLQSRPIIAKLYMGVDKAVKMTEAQLVATATLTQSPNGEITFKLPKTYSGLLYWKLEIVDQLNPSELKDYDSGIIRFRGKKTIVNILQVLPNSGDGSSLLKTENMNQSFLNTDDYQLIITTKSMTQFNDYVAANNTRTPRYGLNGTYDMLLFGFRDVYNSNAPINTLAADAVTDFIETTKQSVMFTHDTVYQNTNAWVTRFKKISGQIEPETNLGLNAPNVSTIVKPVNDGLLTQYPFYLSTLDANNNQVNIITPQVATTHNQYFTLDLEDSTVVPWYNIQSKSTDTDQRDINDSWNHYYTYSKGNVTYSGTGHNFGTTGDRFPEWEQKLFVNTMYRAFTGSNHAPEITVLTPQDNSVKPSYQDNLVVSYTVDDWDIKDKNLVTSMKFFNGSNELTSFKVDDTKVISGQTVTETFANPLPEGGNLQILITAKDAQGALSTKTINVTIQKVTANLSATRSLSAQTVNRDESLTITYTVTPQPIPYYSVDAAEQGNARLLISDIDFKEVLPPNLELAGTLPEGISQSGSQTTGYILTKKIGDIAYRLSEANGVKIYVPEVSQPVTFAVNVIPKVKDSYTLSNGLINFEDIHLDGSLLGIASDYTVFMLKDINLPNSGFTNEGRMAAGQNVQLSYYDIGGQLGSSATGSNIVVAGNNLTLGGGTLNYGMAVFGGTATVPDYLKSKLVQGTPVDFAAASQYLLSRSAYLGALVKTAEPLINYWGGSTCQITLEGTNPTLNVFNISGTDLNNSNDLKIKAPAGSTVIVNVSGASVKMSGGLALTGVDNQHVLFNFSQATSLSIMNIGVQGTVLAPKADIEFQGDVYGHMIGRSMTGGGHYVFLKPFKGSVPRKRTTISFSPTVFTAVMKVQGLMLTGGQIRLDADPVRVIPEINPDDASNKTLSWESSNSDILEIVYIEGKEYLKPKAVGTATITIRSLDGSEKSAHADFNVVSPKASIIGKTTAYVGEKIALGSSFIPIGENITGYSWSIKPDSETGGQPTVASIVSDPNDRTKAVVTAVKTGTVTLQLAITTDRTSTGYVHYAEHVINITNPPQEIRIDGLDTIKAGNSESYQVSVIKPTNPDSSVFQWSIREEDKAYVSLPTLSRGPSLSITGLKETIANHPVVLTVITTGPNGSTITATKEISIGLQLLSLSLESIDPLKVGETYNLIANKKLSATSVNGYAITLEDLNGKLTWSSDNSGIASVSSSGVITATSKGRVKITVSYTDNPKIKASIMVSIDNGDRY